MFELRSNSLMQISAFVTPTLLGMVGIHNTTTENFSLNDGFVYGLIDQAYKDNKDRLDKLIFEEVDQVVYEFEVPVIIHFIRTSDER